MLNKRIFTRSLILIGCLLFLAGMSVAQVSISLPNTTGTIGQSYKVPVTVGALNGLGILSYQFTVSFNSANLTIAADTAATLTSGANLYLANTAVDGKITVTASKTAAFTNTASATLVYLVVTPKAGSKGTTTTLSFDIFKFNETTYTPASATFGVPGLALAVQNTTAAGGVGYKFNIPILTDDLSAQNVKAYLITVKFDTTKIKIANYDATGTLTAQMISGGGLVVPNANVSGKFTLAASGPSNLGTGTILVNLVGEVVSQGSTVVEFEQVKFNEGTPAADGVSGTITLGINTKPYFLTKLAAAITIKEDSSLTFTYTAKDDESNPLTFSLATGAPTGAAITTAGVFTWKPTFDQGSTTPYKVGVVVSDGSLRDTAWTNITVTNVNRAPTVSAKTPAATPTFWVKGTAYAFSVTAADPDGDALTYAWYVNSVKQTAATSSFTYTPTESHGAVLAISNEVSDPSGLKVTTMWSTTVTPVENDVPLPTEFSLNQNYPNPFNPTTNISFDVPKQATVSLEIWSVLGVKIRTLIAGKTMNAGAHTMRWDGRDDAGRVVPTGLYLYRFSAGDFQASKKMMLMK